MKWRFGSGLFVIPNQVLSLALKQVQGLSNSIYRFLDLVFWLMNLGLKAQPCGPGFYLYLPSQLLNRHPLLLEDMGDEMIPGIF